MRCKQAAVVVTWQTNFAIVDGARGDQINHTEKTIGGLSDDAGGWRICGVPRNIPVVVSVATDAGSAARGTTLTEDFGAIDLQLGSNSVTAAEKALASIGAVARRSALVEVAVFNLAGAPVPDVTVDVQPPIGPSSNRRDRLDGSGAHPGDRARAAQSESETSRIQRGTKLPSPWKAAATPFRSSWARRRRQHWTRCASSAESKRSIG